MVSFHQYHVSFSYLHLRQENYIIYAFIKEYLRNHRKDVEVMTAEKYLLYQNFSTFGCQFSFLTATINREVWLSLSLWHINFPAHVILYSEVILPYALFARAELDFGTAK